MSGKCILRHCYYCLQTRQQLGQKGVVASLGQLSGSCVPAKDKATTVNSGPHSETPLYWLCSGILTCSFQNMQLLLQVLRYLSIFNGSLKFRIPICHVMLKITYIFNFLQAVGQPAGSSAKCKTERGCSGHYNPTSIQLPPVLIIGPYGTGKHSLQLQAVKHPPATGDQVRQCLASDLISRARPVSLL